MTATTMYNSKNNRTPINTEVLQRTNYDSKPAWERRIENNIPVLRQEIERLNQFIAGNLSRKKQVKMGILHNNKEDMDKKKYKDYKPC